MIVPYDTSCQEEERVLNEWKQKKTVIQEELDGINNLLRIANAYKNNQDGCDDTLFKREKYSLFSAEFRRLQAKQ